MGFLFHSLLFFSGFLFYFITSLPCFALSDAFLAIFSNLISHGMVIVDFVRGTRGMLLLNLFWTPSFSACGVFSFSSTVLCLFLV